MEKQDTFINLKNYILVHCHNNHNEFAIYKHKSGYNWELISIHNKNGKKNTIDITNQFSWFYIVTTDVIETWEKSGRAKRFTKQELFLQLL